MLLPTYCRFADLHAAGIVQNWTHLQRLIAEEGFPPGRLLSRNVRAWDVIEEIPNDSAAALILLEHHWAVPLRDAILRAGGFRISDGFISPLDLVQIGLATAEEAEELHTMEHTAGKQ